MVIPTLLALAMVAFGVAGMRALSADAPVTDLEVVAAGDGEKPQMPSALRAAARLGAALARRGGTTPAAIEARLTAAGAPPGVGAREVLAAKLGCAGALGAPAVALATVAPGRLGVLIGAILPVTGFVLPDLWLVRRARERARMARRELPSLLDLLRVTIEAGSTLAAALAAVGERGEGPVAREWRVAAREVELGVPTRDGSRRTAAGP